MRPALCGYCYIPSGPYMVVQENKIYGGVYIWESKEHCEAYKAGEIFEMVMTSENHVNPTSKDFGVLEAPTKVTT